MKNYRILLYAFVALLFVGLVGLAGGIYVGEPAVLWELLNVWGARLAVLMSLVVLLAHSSFYKKWTAFIVLPGLLIGIVGSLFKVMHWPGANNLLLLGPGLLVLGYTIHFALKRPIKRQDVLRWIFVVGYCLIFVGTIFHLFGPRFRFAFIGQWLLFVAMIDFLVTKAFLEDDSASGEGEMEPWQ